MRAIKNFTSSYSLFLFICFCISCKPEPPDPIGHFTIKGKLIDTCNGNAINLPWNLAVVYGDNGIPDDQTVSDKNGNFEIKCKLYPTGFKYYLSPLGLDSALKINPKNGDIVDLGDLKIGYKVFLNVKFSFGSVNPTDTLYVGKSVDNPLILTYPIPTSKVVHYGYQTYQSMNGGSSPRQSIGFWGIGKLAFSNAIATQTNKINAKEVPCTPSDTFFVNIP